MRNKHGQVAVPVPGNAAYVYSEAIILAVNVALATHRPLLLAGSPGTGKTALAANVAHVLGWRFYPRVITSRTRARDLMWSFDALRRLGDAQASAHAGAGSLRAREAYIEPQVLWWAFDSDSAIWRGGDPGADGSPPPSTPAWAQRRHRPWCCWMKSTKPSPTCPTISSKPWIRSASRSRSSTRLARSRQPRPDPHLHHDQW